MAGPNALEAVYRERLDTEGDRAPTSAQAYRQSLHDAIDDVRAVATNDYFILRDDDDPASDDVIGDAWWQEVDAAVQEAATAAWNAYVVPAVFRTIISRLADAPAELVNHPEAEVLRADLAVLEGRS